MCSQELFYNLVTQDALLIHGGVAHMLAGPFHCREEAEYAAGALIERLRQQDARGDPRTLLDPTRAGQLGNPGPGLDILC
jgi:hypothetical protein